MRGIMSLCEVAVHRDGLIGDHARASVCRCLDPWASISTLPVHEEGAGLMQHMQAGEIHIASIHDVDGTRFGNKHIERMNIV